MRSCSSSGEGNVVKGVSSRRRTAAMYCGEGTMRILLVGHGRMGKMVESLATEYGCEVAGIVEIDNAGDLRDAAVDWAPVDVAIDFSYPDAVPVNVPNLAALGISVVIGTTGWRAHEDAVRRAVAAAGIGVVAAPNFSTGVVLFDALVSRAAQLFQPREEFGAWLYEAHHVLKKDAPSGTALLLKRTMEEAGYTRPIDVASTRAGYQPGVHTVGFDGPAESITLSHAARDRSAFARGALTAARWLRGKKGWFTMHDVLGLR
jgi:4-hydroxy-tetrahydrodipicolinate reductase